MTEVEKLVLQVENKGASQTNAELNKLDKNAKNAEGSFGKLKAAILGLAAAAGSIAIVGKKLIDSTKTYQGFNAQLEVATGSAEGAAKAMRALTQFASTTPYSVNEATTAFIKLVNLGLTPSEEALRSYGNTASSMNKSLMDFIEAVADAATGEFERLKEFGIKASKEGDKVTFMFRGQKTEVENTSAAIEGYLQTLGNASFGGAMAKQMDTLNGKISNLEDTWDQLWQNIAKTGADRVLMDLFQGAIDVLTELNAMVASGELAKAIEAYVGEWREAGSAVATVFTSLTNLIKGATTLWGLYPQEAGQEFVNFFKHLPINASAAIQAILAWFTKMGAKTLIIFKDMWEGFKIHIEQMVAIAKEAGYAIAAGLQPGVSANFGGAVSTINQITVKQLESLKKRTDAELAAEDAKYEHIGRLITSEADQRITQTERTLEESSALREKYDAEQEAYAADKSDKLAGFAVGSKSQPGSGKSGGKADKEAEKAKKQMEAIFEARLEGLEKGLEGEDRVLDAAYEERKQKVLDNEALTMAEKKDLILRLMEDSLVSEREALERAYQERHDFIISSTLTTETVKSQLLVQLAEQREKAIRDIEQKHQNERLDQASTFFGNIASIGSAFGKKGFKIAQAAAIAEATIDTYKAANGAYASLAKIPYVGPALGAAAAAAAIVAGMARVASIKSQTYSGAYAHGGMVPAGKYGLVGEAGPELVRGPAVVTSASTTGAKASTSGVRSVQVNNYGAPVEATQQMDGDTLRIILKPMLDQAKRETRDELAAEIGKGGGKVSKSLEGTYGLNRANR